MTNEFVNEELLDELKKWLDSQEKREDVARWYQGSWVDALGSKETPSLDDCGTSCCIAGYIALKENAFSLQSISGFPDVNPSWDAMVGRTNYRGETWEAYFDREFPMAFPRGSGYLWPAIGGFYLGISRDDADVLFAPSNTAADLAEMFLELKTTGTITYVAEEYR